MIKIGHFDHLGENVKMADFGRVWSIWRGPGSGQFPMVIFGHFDQFGQKWSKMVIFKPDQTPAIYRGSGQKWVILAIFGG